MRILMEVCLEGKRGFVKEGVFNPEAHIDPAISGVQGRRRKREVAVKNSVIPDMAEP